MRRRITVPAVAIAAFAATISAGTWVAMADDSGTIVKDGITIQTGPELDPTQDASVLASATITYDTTVGETSGPSADVAAVQAAAPNLMSQILNLSDLPQDPLARVTALVTSLTNLNTLASTLFDPTTLVNEVTSLTQDLQLRATTAAMEMMQSVAFGAPTWDRVDVTGDDATAVFTADLIRTTTDEGTIDDGSPQFHVQLHRGTDGVWRIVSWGDVRPEGGN